MFRTGSGTFKDGDLLVNRDGVRIVSNSEVEVVRRLNSFSLIALMSSCDFYCISHYELLYTFVLYPMLIEYSLLVSNVFVHDV